MKQQGLIRGNDAVDSNILHQMNDMAQRIATLEKLLLTQDHANLLYLSIEDASPIAHPAVSLDSNAGTILSLSTQEIGLDAQNDNLVFAGPATGGPSVPSFRSLVDADIPASIARDSELHDPVTLDADAATIMDLSTQVIGLLNQNANLVFAGPAAGGANEPTFRSLVSSDLPTGATLSVSSGNSGTSHAITTSSNPGAAAAILASNSTGALTLQRLYINDTADVTVTNGIVINQGSATDAIATFKASDVAHGMTDEAETDTYGFFQKAGDADGAGGGTAGGLRIRGLRDSGGIAARALVLSGFLGEAADTTTVLGSSGSPGVVQLTAGVQSGTGATVVAAAGNAFVFSNFGTTLALLKGNGDFHYVSNLIAYRNSTSITGHIFVPLTTPWSHASWNLTAYSTVSTSTQLDMSGFTGAPGSTSHIKAYLLELVARDSASWGTNDLHFSVGPNSTYWYMAAARPFGGDVLSSLTAIVPCDSNGDVWYRIGASGASTIDIVVRVWGYFV